MAPSQQRRPVPGGDICPLFTVSIHDLFSHPIDSHLFSLERRPPIASAVCFKRQVFQVKPAAPVTVRRTVEFSSRPVDPPNHKALFACLKAGHASGKFGVKSLLYIRKRHGHQCLAVEVFWPAGKSRTVWSLIDTDIQ